MTKLGLKLAVNASSCPTQPKPKALSQQARPSSKEGPPARSRDVEWRAHGI